MSHPEQRSAAEALLSAAAEGVYAINPEEFVDLSARLEIMLGRAGKALFDKAPTTRYASELGLEWDKRLAVLGEKISSGVRTAVIIGGSQLVRDQIDDHMRGRDK